MTKFLIDEGLSPTLVQLARERGHGESTHVNWLGLRGETDWGLMPRIIEGDFTFVTNNAKDFRKLYAKEPVSSFAGKPGARSSAPTASSSSLTICVDQASPP